MYINGKEITIYAVDFDGTISLGAWPHLGEPNKELIDFLNFHKKYGDKIILWSCREGVALEEAVDYSLKHGLAFDAINNNIPEVIEHFGVNSRKVSCDYYIDDKAMPISMMGTKVNYP